MNDFEYLQELLMSHLSFPSKYPIILSYAEYTHFMTHATQTLRIRTINTLCECFMPDGNEQESLCSYVFMPETIEDLEAAFER